MLFSLQRNELNQVFAAVSACLSCLAGGLVLAYTSSAVPSLQSNSTGSSGDPLYVTDDEASWLGGLLPLGALVGSLGMGILINLFGRKRSLLLITAPGFTIGWLVIALAQNLAMLYVGRFIGGVCVGMCITGGPLYIMETADVKLRGLLGSLPQVHLTLGILISYIFGAFLNWMWLAVASLLFIIPNIICLLMVKESPVWLFEKGKTQEALEALQWLRSTPEEAKEDLHNMETAKKEKEEQKQESGFSKLKEGPILKAFLCCVTLMFFQQFSGVNLVIFYTVTIFKAAGSTIDPNLSAIIVGIVQFIATCSAAALVERLGRKPLLAFSALFMCICLTALATFFYLQSNDQADGLGWLPLVSLMVYISAFSLGYGPLTWLMAAEMLPQSVRIAINPLAVAFNWGCVFIVTYTYAQMQAAMQLYGCYWFYAVICGIGVIFSLLGIPETKGKTMEEISVFFGNKKVAPMSNGNGTHQETSFDQDKV